MTRIAVAALTSEAFAPLGEVGAPLTDSHVPRHDIEGESALCQAHDVEPRRSARQVERDTNTADYTICRPDLSVVFAA